MACRKPRQRASSRPKECAPRKPLFRLEHPGDPIPADPRAKGPRPWDPAWVGQAMRKRGMTAIHKNYKFGRECNTTAVLFFYNTIHDFWDGSVYTPDGKPPQDADKIIRCIMRRQDVSEVDGELVRHTAKERKQMAKAKPYRVQKQTTERSLRPRKPPVDAQRGSHAASPALTQITVAGSDSVLGDRRGASIWSVPCSPASPIVGLQGNCDDDEDDELGDDGVDGVDGVDGEESSPTGLVVSTSGHSQDVFQRQHDPRASPTAIEHDAEGEPCEAADGGAAFAHDGAGESTHFEELQEHPVPSEFIATMAGDDAWMNMGMPMEGFQDMADFGMDGLGDLNLDMDMGMDMDMDMPSDAGDLQEPPCSHSQKAPMAILSTSSTVASAASPHEVAGENRQTSSATAADESAPQPVPEPEWSATPEEVLMAMQQALLGLIAERGWDLGPYQDFGGSRKPHAPANMSIPVLA